MVRWMGVAPLLPGVLGWPISVGGIASCCGSVHVTKDKKAFLESYKKRIYWERVLGEDVPLPEKSMECLLIPDVVGNVFIQWEDT